MISHDITDPPSVLAGSGLSFGETGRYSCPKAIWECANAQGRSHVGRSKRNEANKCKRGSGPGFVWTFLRAITSYYELWFSAFMRFFERLSHRRMVTMRLRLVGGGVKTCRKHTRTTQVCISLSITNQHFQAVVGSYSPQLSSSRILSLLLLL